MVGPTEFNRSCYPESRYFGLVTLRCLGGLFPHGGLCCGPLKYSPWDSNPQHNGFWDRDLYQLGYESKIPTSGLLLTPTLPFPGHVLSLGFACDDDCGPIYKRPHACGVYLVPRKRTAVLPLDDPGISPRRRVRSSSTALCLRWDSNPQLLRSRRRLSTDWST